MLTFALTVSGAAAADAVPSPTDLTVLVGDVVVSGGFSHMTHVTEKLTAPFVGRRATAEQLQALAHALELLYNEEGYFLVRVTIPPQQINDGDAFRMMVIDGYLEDVDLTSVPPRARDRLAKLLASIVNRPGLKMAELERVLMLARQMPGLSVRTTLMPGTGAGASLLIVEGELTKYGGGVNFQRRLAADAAPWGTSLHMQLNQPFGRGEQLNGHVSGPARSFFDPIGPRANERTVGGGVRWPVGSDGATLHVGFTESRTYTPAPHPLIPATQNELQRISVEFNKPLVLRRSGELGLSATVDALEQIMEAPDFAAMLYRDGLRIVRIGATGRRDTGAGSHVSFSVQLSQGLYWGARTQDDVQQSGIPFSRLDAEPAFRKLNATGTWRLPLTSGLILTSSLRGQYSAVGPLPATELFSLVGPNALPSLAIGVGANDHGWTLREHVETNVVLGGGNVRLTPYGYVAAGSSVATVPANTKFALAAGLGIRAETGAVKLSLEFAAGRHETMFDNAFVANVEVGF